MDERVTQRTGYSVAWSSDRQIDRAAAGRDALRRSHNARNRLSVRRAACGSDSALCVRRAARSATLSSGDGVARHAGLRSPRHDDFLSSHTLFIYRRSSTINSRLERKKPLPAGGISRSSRRHCLTMRVVRYCNAALWRAVSTAMKWRGSNGGEPRDEPGLRYATFYNDATVLFFALPLFKFQ